MERREIYMENEISKPGDFEYIPEDHMDCRPEPQDGFDATDREAAFYEMEELTDDDFDCEFEDDGQPSEYTEWQDYMGGDDWDHGQYDNEY